MSRRSVTDRLLHRLACQFETWMTERKQVSASCTTKERRTRAKMAGSIEPKEKNGPDGGIRTPDTRFRRPVLYPLSYVRMKGPNIPADVGGAPGRSRG